MEFNQIGDRAGGPVKDSMSHADLKLKLIKTKDHERYCKLFLNSLQVKKPSAWQLMYNSAPAGWTSAALPLVWEFTGCFS
jgi:hypothetical protein